LASSITRLFFPKIVLNCDSQTVVWELDQLSLVVCFSGFYIWHSFWLSLYYSHVLCWLSPPSTVLTLIRSLNFFKRISSQMPPAIITVHHQPTCPDIRVLGVWKRKSRVFSPQIPVSLSITSKPEILTLYFEETIGNYDKRLTQRFLMVLFFFSFFLEEFVFAFFIFLL
jgi:hypothetical protein